MKARRGCRVMRLLAAAAVVGLSAIGLSPVLAQAQEPQVQSWALAPTGTDPSEPSSRPNLSYEMAPGSTTDDSVTLWNYGNTQLTFRIYATDAFNNSQGGFDLLAGDKTPTGVGSWVRLPQANVTVAAGTKIDLPFTLAVPPDARAGDHAAAILASSEVDGVGPDGKIVKLDRRTGSRLYLRVAGPLTPGLAVEELHTAYRPALNPFGGSVDVSYTVRNVGNVRLGAHQLVTLENPFGSRMKRESLDDITELLPGNTMVVRARLDDAHAVVRFSATVTLTPFPAAQPSSPSQAVEARRQAWAIPWSVGALMVVGLFGWRRRRRHARRQPLDAELSRFDPSDKPRPSTDRETDWLPAPEPEVTSARTAGKQSLRPAYSTRGFLMVRGVTSDAPWPAAAARPQAAGPGRFFRSRRAAWSCAAATALFVLVVMVATGCSSGGGKSDPAAPAAAPGNGEGFRAETAGIPARVDFANTRDLADGSEVSLKVTAEPGSQVFGIEAFLCRSDATYRFDADLRPTLLGKCASRPLSERSDDYMEVASVAPFEVVEAKFRAGVGTDTFKRDDGKAASVTCGPTSPCRIVLKVQYPNGFGFVSQQIEYR